MEYCILCTLALLLAGSGSATKIRGHVREDPVIMIWTVTAVLESLESRAQSSVSPDFNGTKLKHSVVLDYVSDKQAFSASCN